MKIRPTLLLLFAIPSLMGQVIQGAGGSFPLPLYSKWFSDYQKSHPQVQINYQNIGSGGGIKQILEGVVDFGATDSPMTEQERSKAQSTLHHIPMALGAVAIAYCLPGISHLNLSQDILAGIYLGHIRHWNDPKIAAFNMGAKLPGLPITVAYSSRSSGTTAVFTEYLSKVSPEWKTKVGQGKSVKFPVGIGAKGNIGIAGLVQVTPGALGYLELSFAKQNSLSMAALRNRKGNFILPALENISSLTSGSTVPKDLCLSVTDSGGDKDYPIASLTYILVHEHQKDPVKGKALADFLWWAVHEGQKSAPALDYAPLSNKLVSKIEEKLKALQAGGKYLIGKNKAQ